MSSANILRNPMKIYENRIGDIQGLYRTEKKRQGKVSWKGNLHKQAMAPLESGTVCQTARSQLVLPAALALPELRTWERTSSMTSSRSAARTLLARKRLYTASRT